MFFDDERIVSRASAIRLRSSSEDTSVESRHLCSRESNKEKKENSKDKAINAESPKRSIHKAVERFINSKIDKPTTTNHCCKSAESVNSKEQLSAKTQQNCDASKVDKKKAPPIRKGKKCTESLDEVRKPDSRKFSSWYNRSARSFGRSLEKSKSQDKIILEKCAENKRALCKLRKLSRSSLTIEPDINLSKYSPCASRLAASSKILAGDNSISPESPLHHVSRSRSPFKLKHNMQTQAELSLNIQCLRKDTGSCITSPASEATTLSCSPTNTEIVSLDEVTEAKLDKLRASTLETKC